MTTTSLNLPPLPPVKANLIGFTYVIATLRDQIAYHYRDYETDPTCHGARIVELEAAIARLTKHQRDPDGVGLLYSDACNRIHRVIDELGLDKSIPGDVFDCVAEELRRTRRP